MSEQRNPTPETGDTTRGPAAGGDRQPRYKTTAPWVEATEPPGETISRLTQGHVLAGRYRVEKLLGSGGMADVYQAWDRELDESIAVKVLHPGVAKRDAMVGRFKKEIKLARKIMHPNVCRIYDFGSAENLVFVTMERLEGSTLGALPGGYGALGLDRMIAIFRGILAGLEAAHELGIIHRDLKPQNVMVCPDGRPVIMDFGIARELDATEITTATSEVIGTPAYMAPERMLGEKVDLRADLYSLGVLLFEMATGQRPFSGITVFDMAQNQLSVDPPRPTAIEPGVPRWLERIILKLLAKRPEDRFQSVAEVAAQLHAALEEPSPAGERIKTVLLVDDDSAMLNIVGVHLNQAGISVVTARNGGDGIELVLAKEPDLVCLDFSMPEMDGFQVAAYLRRLGHQMPIFMLTGIQDPQYEKEAARLGIEQFFTKPLDIETFVETVRDRLAAP